MSRRRTKVQQMRNLGAAAQAAPEPAPKVDFAKILKPYEGDLFGTRGESADGMVYLSRMQNDPYKGSGVNVERRASPSSRLRKNTVELRLEHKAQIAVLADKAERDVQARRRCATAICSLAAKGEDTIERIISEGAIGTLLALAATEDGETKTACASSLYSMAATQEHAARMIGDHGVAALALLAKAPLQPNERAADVQKRKLTCVAAICWLSTCAGCEAALVGDGAVNAVQDALGATPSSQMRLLCAATLLNLSVVSGNYTRMEAVGEAAMDQLKNRCGCTHSRRTLTPQGWPLAAGTR
jgi:hypothetical protein